jgi:hypothetical protein
MMTAPAVRQCPSAVVGLIERWRQVRILGGRGGDERAALNRALVLEAPQTRVPDGAGGFALTWGALGTLWAEVVAGAGRDRPARRWC